MGLNPFKVREAPELDNLLLCRAVTRLNPFKVREAPEHQWRI